VTLDEFLLPLTHLKLRPHPADIDCVAAADHEGARGMIDLDRLEQRLELSLTEDLRVHRSTKTPAHEADRAVRPEPRSEPRPRARPEPRREALAAPRPETPPDRGTEVLPDRRLGLADHARRAAERLGAGDRRGADHHIGAHADLAGGRGRPADRRDAAALAVMVALLDGRQAEARSRSDAVLALGREAGDGEAIDHYWAQRLWVVLEWGDEEEHGQLLDYCRERAYGDGDTAWMGAISLLLARAGRVDEARAAFDAATRALDVDPGSDAWLDLVTDLAEAAAMMGDRARAATVARALARTSVPPVAIGRGWVCKGATARYRGLLAAALGRGEEADREYRAAIDVHRRIEAGPLLARTLHEWGRALQGRDDLRSRSYLQEGADLGRRLALADFVPRSGARAS
jgi:hypothetical protein